MQPRRLLTESPETYRAVVEPYIASFPPERIAWVHAILDGKKEAERVLFNRVGQEGFMILPDLKWDGTTTAALYLTALVRDGAIRSMRDLERKHIPLLKDIKQVAYAVCSEKWGVGAGELRLFVHYQPSYCKLEKARWTAMRALTTDHFHVHIVHVTHEVMAGMAVGQAHMLDDVINWVSYPNRCLANISSSFPRSRGPACPHR